MYRANQTNQNQNSQPRMGLSCVLTLGFSFFAALLSFSTVQAEQLVLTTDFTLRTLRGTSMQHASTLAAGSVIDIPDAYVTRDSYGQPDLQKTLDTWMARAGVPQTPPLSLMPAVEARRAEANDMFFPIRVVTAAPGTTNAGLLNDNTYYMSLRVLHANRGLSVASSRDRIPNAPRAAPNDFLVPTPTFRQNHIPAAAPAARPATPPAPTTGAAGLCPGGCANETRPLSGAGDRTLRESMAALGRVAPAPAAPPRAAPAYTAAAPGTFQRLPNQFQRIRGRRSMTEAMPDNCRNFIDSNGNLGSWGRMVRNEISKYRSSFLSPGNGMSRTCRNFDSWGDAQKIHYFAWILASLSIQESSCNPNAASSDDRSLNPNGVAAGLFQMEERPDLRRRRDLTYASQDRALGRGNLGPYCSPDIYSPEINIRCSIRIMDNMMRTGEGVLAVVRRGGTQYWGPLNGSKNNTAQTLIRSYAACGN